MIISIYCLVLQNASWMSSARMDNLGYLCVNASLWHSGLFIFSCLSLLPAFRAQNGFCTNTVTMIRQGVWTCKMPSFPSKQKQKQKHLKLKGFLVAIFLICSTAFPHKQLSWQSHWSIVLQFRDGEKIRRWSERQKYLRPLLPQGTGHCRAAALCSACSLAQTQGRTLEKLLGITVPQCLDFWPCIMESLSASQPGEDQNCIWRALYEWLLYMLYCTHAFVNTHAYAVPFLWPFLCQKQTYGQNQTGLLWEYCAVANFTTGTVLLHNLASFHHCLSWK